MRTVNLAIFGLNAQMEPPIIRFDDEVALFIIIIIII